MGKADGVKLTLTHECGHEFEVPIAGKHLDTLDIHCPGCGVTFRLDPDQVATIVAGHGQLADHAGKALRDAEFDFRYSNRIALGVNDTDRAAIALKGMEGKRLTYRRTGLAAA